MVVLANPGETRATANLTAFGTTPAYQPQGGGNISIPAHSSVSVPLENACWARHLRFRSARMSR